jgi:hypothetical protein
LTKAATTQPKDCILESPEMMSSAIPARLLFQCGHAALVTLPRVKGESAAQRNERVAREKSSALARQCDFCGPAVEVGVASNGNHLEIADVLAAEPVVVAEPLVVDVEEVPVAIVAQVAVIEEPVGILEVTELVVEEPLAVVVALVEEPAEPAKRARRGPKLRVPAPRPTTSGQRFIIEYRAERVLQAANIQAAVRQATGLGASEILEIERVD